MKADSTILGVDAGSVSVSVAEIDRNGNLTGSFYALHKGDVRGTLLRLLEQVKLENVAGIGATAAAGNIVKADRTFDPGVAYISAARKIHGRMAALLIVGGEKFSLIGFDGDGGYSDSRGSSPCAAGTGSFLDQQAGRLGLEGSAALSRTALAAEGATPKIASRCSVFAKTDLIHAQQEGHSIEAICNGLCHGLAANVVDTLFGGSSAPEGKIVFAGGVSRNEAVKKHIETLIGHDLIVDEYSHVYGAYGAALLRQADLDSPVRSGGVRKEKGFGGPDDLLMKHSGGREYFYEPLLLRLSKYPDFSATESYVFNPSFAGVASAVEVDVYRSPARGGTVRAWLGIDIGSTSTKAVLLGLTPDLSMHVEETAYNDKDDRVIAGFYTRTAGRPLIALQAVLESIDAWRVKAEIRIEIEGAGTTGSGRKFIGAIIGADQVVDEITAHAKAAWRLDPSVDTIMEIGGQDAKFTTIRDGTVTLSIMNNVCAAGTGSFIEEQAARLSCPLPEYAARAEGKAAPLASDRCTVFMERDINHYLSAGYSVDEILAAVLHSVRENYMRKVARESLIGDRICFQGATAKNRSLVAAFEQKLGKPVNVSRYCHLTGALGVAMILEEEKGGTTSFKGLDLYRERIPIRGEVCTLCRNHCKLNLATVRGETVAYGMLCGRDYRDERYVSSNKSGFDLLKAVEKHFAFEPGPKKFDVVIGIPAGLSTAEEMPLWKKFFDSLGVKTVTSEGFKDVVASGKRLAGAEFCAPIAALHGHVAGLAREADYIFVPFYMEDGDRPPGTRRNYCYYTQFAGSLVATIPTSGVREKLLTPVINNCESVAQKILRLYRTLKPVLGGGLGLLDVARAYRGAVRFYNGKRRGLPAVMKREIAGAKDVSIVLLGRPYTVLSPAMNSSIPEIMSSMGVKCFWQDMLDYTDGDISAIRPLLDDVHWTYAARELAAAEVVGKTPGLYPILITSFKCAPDSCITEPLRRILDSHGKPYLILQLDEHDSQTGYETRIEAAIRSFRNHLAGRKHGPVSTLPVNPRRAPGMRGKTVLLPCWDRFSGTLMAANFRREGIDAHVLEEDDLLIARGLRHNAGQCIPLNIMVEESVAYMEKHGIKPENAVVWIHSSQLGCNIGAFPQTIQMLLESRGGGYEKAMVYVGQMTGSDISVRAVINQYLAFICTGYMRLAGCRIRPYEINPGETDRVIEESLAVFADAFEKGGEIFPVVRKVVDRLRSIRKRPGNRPKVAVFGDLYSRDNDVLSQNLVKVIEANGGEVITTPYTEYTKIIAGAYLSKWFHEGKYRQVASSKVLLESVKVLERRFVREFERVVGPKPKTGRRRSMEKILAQYNVTTQHTGESLENILKIHHLIEAHPDIALFVQMSPAFCCPSLVTEAMSQEIRRVTGIPVVTVTYDGTRSPKNDIVIPYLHFLGEKHGK